MKKFKLIKLFLFLSFALLIFLRFYKLDSLISPYWEEVAIGYDAYSVAKTSKDHHGNFLPIVAFESFGDFKPGLYFYLVVPIIKLISLNVLAVRLPAAIAGLLIIFGNAFLVQNIWSLIKKKPKKSDEKTVFFIALFLTALSSWAFIFSRAAWEVNLATALVLWGVNFFVLFIKKETNKAKLVFMLLSVSSFLLSTYAYHGARITAPLLGLSLIVFYFYQEIIIKKEKFKIFLQKNYIFLLSGLILAILGFYPIFKNLNSPLVQQRAREASIFYDLEIIKESNMLIEAAGGNTIAKIRYHRYLLFAREIIKNYFNHFNFNYLFVSGDNNPRHSVQAYGTFYILDLILFFFALIFLIKNFSLWSLFIVIYLVVGILPGAISKASPHALRTLLAMPAFITLLTLGAWQLKQLLKVKLKFILIVFILAYFYCSTNFFDFYFFDYPQLYQKEWQYGYQQLITRIESINDGEIPIFISREQGRPAMYYWFYTKSDPRQVQDWNNLAKKDQGEYLEYKNISFFDDFSAIDSNSGLIAASPKKLVDFMAKNPQLSYELIDEIATAGGEVLWQIYSIHLN